MDVSWCPLCEQSLAGLSNHEANEHVDLCLNAASGLLGTGAEDRAEFDRHIPCPVLECRTEPSLGDLFAHLVSEHPDLPSGLLCPLCSADASPVSTSLLDHMFVEHRDFMATALHSPRRRGLLSYSSSREVSVTFVDLDSNSSPPTATGGGAAPSIVLPITTTGDYVISQRSTPLEEECIICFEHLGVEIATLDCFCRFHPHCIGSWFAKKQAKDCPIHKQ
mmetsp:Transcript_20541/g.52014  ORF Transcript_20541/g.52014 Transcript_20541/m.52014 type:complete len:221 (-) Transcript_20541:157-819(-)|eukprot:CAMPEP_0174233068 /NCGR_PEP_ID=MMETSP0417-20130205/3208_1 /TAXON_ID=242541 /ORGANISM="Mayorella sp, Strain BSH-02190019" /LENGTH=220 /DNA_ID=CAMNT_0015311229 /DNA_START=168 /DNA_END=830 /DNA_ORIENTATION=-